MVDYYEELKLGKTLSLQEINKEISLLESTWTQRQINVPEKATKMLALVIDARVAFKTDSSRAEYDRALEDSKREPLASDTDSERAKSFEKWYSDAKGYVGSQNDLAKVAIDKALQYATSETIDQGFYRLAALIYSFSGNHIQALDFANQAIVIAPEDHISYGTKGDVLENYINKISAHNSETNDLNEQMVSTFKIAVEKAKTNGDNNEVGRSLEKLDRIYYYNNYFIRNGNNVPVAEAYAQEATNFGWGDRYAKDVLHDIESKRYAAIHIFDEAREAQKNGNVTLAAELYQKILIDNPDDLEANFYAIYNKAMTYPCTQLFRCDTISC